MLMRMKLTLTVIFKIWIEIDDFRISSDFSVSDSIGESVGADQEADEMEKNDNLDPIEISEMENGGLEPDDDPTDDSSDTDGGSDGGEVSLAKFHNFYDFLFDLSFWLSWCWWQMLDVGDQNDRHHHQRFSFETSVTNIHVA